MGVVAVILTNYFTTMDKRHISVDIDKQRYKHFVEIKNVFGDTVMTSKEIFELFKTNDIPASAKYFTYMMKHGFFTKVAINKYKFAPREITLDDFRKCFLEVRAYDMDKKAKQKERKEIEQHGIPKLQPISKQEKINKYVEFLKSEGYKVQKPVERQVVTTVIDYVEC